MPSLAVAAQSPMLPSAVPTDTTPIASGSYVLNADSPLRPSPSTATQPLELLPKGFTVMATGETSNFFAKVLSSGGPLDPVWGTFGWIALPNIDPASPAGAAAPGGMPLPLPLLGGAVPGGPNQGANTPPPGQTPGAPPGAPPAVFTTPAGGPAPSSGGSALPIVAAVGIAALLIIEQKKKRRR